jgi:hypothetical protein
MSAQVSRRSPQPSAVCANVIQFNPSCTVHLLVDAQEPEATMPDPDVIARYNYDEFTPEKVLPWLNFESSPGLGQRAPDFPLWQLEDGRQLRLSDLWSKHTYTIIEFGSFT